MKGIFPVPMIHSTVLIDMSDSQVDQLQFFPAPPSYYGDIDDLLIFAYAAQKIASELLFFFCFICLLFFGLLLLRILSAIFCKN